MLVSKALRFCSDMTEMILSPHVVYQDCSRCLRSALPIAP